MKPAATVLRLRAPRHACCSEILVPLRRPRRIHFVLALYQHACGRAAFSQGWVWP